MSADDQNVTSVIDQLRNREKAGLIKYGTNTERTDLDTIEWLQHLQEELMDGAVYIERLKRDLSRPEIPDAIPLESTGSLLQHADWHPGHEAPNAYHEGDRNTEKERAEDKTYEAESSPAHVKIPTDDD